MHTANGVAHLLENRFPNGFVRCLPRDDGGGTLVVDGSYTTYSKDQLEELYRYLVADAPGVLTADQ